MVAGSGLGRPLPSLLLVAPTGPPAAAPSRSGEQVAAVLVLVVLHSARSTLFQGHLLGDGLSGLCSKASPCLGVTCASMRTMVGW